MKPVFEDTHCPRCGDSDGITTDEAVHMVLPFGKGKWRMRVIWCTAGHVTVIDEKGIVLTKITLK